MLYLSDKTELITSPAEILVFLFTFDHLIDINHYFRFFLNKLLNTFSRLNHVLLQQTCFPIWKLPNLNSVEDASDLKGSVVIFDEDDEEDVRVEQYRLFVYICLSVFVCKYLMSLYVCVWVCLGVFCFYFVSNNCTVSVSNTPPSVVQYEECQWADCCRPGSRPGIP